MRATATDLLALLPGPVTDQWPSGERFVGALSHGSMSVELYAPVGSDPQARHDKDELYFTISGTGVLRIGPERQAFGPGACFFVAAGVSHQFEECSADFTTWVVFWGPAGGE